MKISNVEQVEQNEDSQKLLFCQKCLSIPHFSIEVESNGNIFICHLCDKNKIKRNLELFEREEKPEKRCYICDSQSVLICARCSLIVCEKCFKMHDNFILAEEEICDNEINNNINKENELYDSEPISKSISIYELQFICKKHIKEFTHYCQKCKINLCDDCLIFHEHINNIKFTDIIKKEKRIESFLEEKAETQTIDKLLKISKLFVQCFNICKANQRINIEIILNYWIILEIKKFIQEKKERGVICNTFVLENNKSYYSKYFFDKDFVSNYERLLLDVESGNINSFHSLNNIKNQYNNHKKIYLNNYEALKKSYLLRLSFLEIDIKPSVLYVKGMIQAAKYNYTLVEIAKLYEELNMQNNMLEYNLELLKKLLLQMIYRLDFQLRRKTSNLITKELFNNFYENMHNYQDEIKNKFNNSLELIKNRDLNEIRKLETDEIKEDKNDIIFINLNEGDEEYLKAVLFNLFMIIRKELNSKFNNSIHNEIQNINYLLTNGNNIQNEDIDNNNNSNNFDYNKDYFSNVGSLKYGNVDENKEKNSIKDKTCFINKLCKKKIKIIENIEKYAINDHKIKFPNIIGLFSEGKIKQSFSHYSENKFINYLQETQKLYNIPFESSVKNSLNLFLKGNKSNLLYAKNIYLNSDSLKNDLNKIKNSLKKNEGLENSLAEIIEELNSNIKNVYEIISDVFKCLEEYKDIYNIKTILKKADIKIPFNPMMILLSKNIKIDIEQKYILKEISAYLILKNYYEELIIIKNKIKELNLTKLDKEIKLKIKFIDYFLSKIDENEKFKNLYFEDIWNSLKERKYFLGETNEKTMKINQKIKEYVETHSCEDYINDFDICVNPLIKSIDFSQDDPQDLEMIPFMK